MVELCAGSLSLVLWQHEPSWPTMKNLALFPGAQQKSIFFFRAPGNEARETYILYIGMAYHAAS